VVIVIFETLAELEAWDLRKRLSFHWAA
jgi:hypothetical protein